MKRKRRRSNLLENGEEVGGCDGTETLAESAKRDESDDILLGGYLGLNPRGKRQQKERRRE